MQTSDGFFYQQGRYNKKAQNSSTDELRTLPDKTLQDKTLQDKTAPPLRFYLDTADADMHRQWLSTGLFYGVTCNPLLLERANVPCTTNRLAKLAEQACELGAQEVHLQAWGDTSAKLIEVGQALAKASDRIIVKLPATQIGTTAARVLIQKGIPITLTAVYATHQVLIAAAIGASYAAPYLGRISDSGKDGLAEVANMQRTLRSINSPARLLTASIRQIEDIAVLAAQGVDTFTFSDKIAQSFFNQADTEQAALDFEQAALRMMP